MKNFPKLFLTRGLGLRVVICAALIGFVMIACNIPTNDVADGGDGGAVSSVSISPSDAAVAKGGSKTFTATVAGTGSFATTVTWSIAETGKHEGTTIGADGTLTVSDAESLAQLTVKATSTADNTKSGTASVTVTAVSVSPLDGTWISTTPVDTGKYLKFVAENGNFKEYDADSRTAAEADWREIIRGTYPVDAVSPITITISEVNMDMLGLVGLEGWQPWDDMPDGIKQEMGETPIITIDGDSFTESGRDLVFENQDGNAPGVLDPPLSNFDGIWISTNEAPTGKYMKIVAVDGYLIEYMSDDPEASNDGWEDVLRGTYPTNDTNPVITLTRVNMDMFDMDGGWLDWADVPSNIQTMMGGQLQPVSISDNKFTASGDVHFEWEGPLGDFDYPYVEGGWTARDYDEENNDHQLYFTDGAFTLSHGSVTEGWTEIESGTYSFLTPGNMVFTVLEGNSSVDEMQGEYIESMGAILVMDMVFSRDT